MKVGLIAQGAIQKFINVTNDCSFSCKKRGETTATLKEKNAFPFTLCSCYNSESWILKAFSSCFCYYFINRFLLDRNSREKQYQEARNCFYCSLVAMMDDRQCSPSCAPALPSPCLAHWLLSSPVQLGNMEMHTPQTATRREVIAFPALHQQFILGAEEQEEMKETGDIICCGYTKRGCWKQGCDTLEKHHMTLINSWACKLQLTHQNYLFNFVQPLSASTSREPRWGWRGLGWEAEPGVSEFFPHVWAQDPQLLWAVEI